MVSLLPNIYPMVSLHPKTCTMVSLLPKTYLRVTLFPKPCAMVSLLPETYIPGDLKKMNTFKFAIIRKVIKI